MNINKLFRTAVGALALVGVVVALACGGGGGGGGGGNVSYPKIPAHPVYGDLPQLAAKWNAKDSALKADEQAAYGKAKGESDYSKIKEKFEKLKEQASAEQEKDYADAVAKLKGLPFEVKDGVGYSVKSVEIIRGGFNISLEVTDKKKLNVTMMGVGKGLMNYLDADGKVIQEDVEFYGLGGLENGATKTINFANNGFDVAKIVFTK